MSRKHNIVYKITNTISSMWYIGVHSTDDLNDGYMGSGVVLKQAIAKYGKANFEKEILYDFESIEEAYQKESELVTVEVMRDWSSYNIKTGGYGGQCDNNITYTHINTKQGWIPKEDYDPNLHVGHNKDMVIVRDSEGNLFSTDRDHPKYLSGEWLPWNKGLSPSEESNLKEVKHLSLKKGTLRLNVSVVEQYLHNLQLIKGI